MPMSKTTKIIILCAVTGAIIAVIVVPLVAPGAIGAIFGVGASGPAAGGVFAALQAAGVVVAGGVYAMLQSIAMGGAIPMLVLGAAGLFGAGLGGLLAYMGTRRRAGRST